MRVGKLNTANLFPTQEEVEEEEAARLRFYKPTVQPKKIRLEKVFQEESRSGQEGDNEPASMVVGKLRNPFPQQEAEGERPPVLRGARKLNKGNRISCLIENLGNDKEPKEESDEEQDEEEEDKEVEDLKLGRERMSQLQNLFSGQDQNSGDSPVMRGGKFPGGVTSPNRHLEKSDSVQFSSLEFEELSGEGLVSTNLQRFLTGNIRGSHQVTNRKTSLETNYIDRKHLESVAAKFECENSSSLSPTPSERIERPVGKLRNPDAIFQNNKDETSSARPGIKVGKLNTENLFAEGEDNPGAKEVIRVGKLNTENLFQKSESQADMSQPVVRVGKLNTDNLFGKVDEESSREPVPKVRVGRINTDNLFNKQDDTPKDVPVVKVGRINTDNLFSKPDTEAREVTPAVRIGKINTDNLFNRPAEDTSPDIPAVRVGKLNTENLFSKQVEDTPPDTPPVRVGKLNTDNLFAKQEEEKSRDAQPRLVRVGKLNTDNLFGKQEEEEEVAKSSPEGKRIGKINTDNLFGKQEVATEERRRSITKVGKLNTENLFSKPAEPESPQEQQRVVRVGKINTENLFAKQQQVEAEDEGREGVSPKIGKINTENLFAKADTSPSPSEKTGLRVGKISTKNLFDNQETETETVKIKMNVGKLSEDRLQVGSEAESPDVERDSDTHIVPAGTVSKSASAFLNQKKVDEPGSPSSPSARPPSIHTDTAAAAELQRKYEEQTNGTLKRKTKQVERVSSFSVTSGGGGGGSGGCSSEAVVQPGKMEEARSQFFQSMVTNSSESRVTTSSAHRLGTSILPAMGAGDPAQGSRGKQLFQRLAERQEQETNKQDILPGVDLEEIEDEFERLHREMIAAEED